MLGSGSGTLSSIPSALVRWTEESRALDGDSVHDCITGLKPGIIEILEKYRDEELTERREKRKKMQEEEDAKKKETESKHGPSDARKPRSESLLVASKLIHSTPEAGIAESSEQSHRAEITSCANVNSTQGQATPAPLAVQETVSDMEVTNDSRTESSGVDINYSEVISGSGSVQGKL